VQTYADYAWPAALGALYRRNGLALALATAFGLALFMMLLLGAGGVPLQTPLGGNFYAVFAHNTLVLMFGAVFAFAVLALALGTRAFWRSTTQLSQTPAASASAARPGAAAAQAAREVLSLKYLDGGHGDGCNEASDAFTLARRRFHHLTFYGFLLCFAATCVATLYHYGLGLHAPYALDSLPVVLGTAGGIGLLVGPAGLLWLNLRRYPSQGDPAQRPMDRGFIALLFFTSLTGLALLVWRDSSAMAWLLAVHLGVVMAFFLTMPYGKFAHGVYRGAALLKYAIERRSPRPFAAGGE
jgi:citrate/tricarballylate utilization protein